MIIKQNRRTVLKGLGVSLALPLMESLMTRPVLARRISGPGETRRYE